MARWIGLLLLGFLPFGPALAEEPPATICAGDGAGRRCTASMVQSFANNRGGVSEVSVSIVRDAACTTLHIVFDAPIALDRPVSLTADGAPPQRFYTPGELADLARALDGGAQPPSPAPEVASFLSLVATGAIADADAGPEMIKRFAAIKEPRRVGLTCGPMERLRPSIHAGHPLRLEFQVEPRAVTQVYHWPNLGMRTVDLRVDALLASLDEAMPGS